MKLILFLFLMFVLTAFPVYGDGFAIDGGSKFFSGEVFYEQGFGEAYDSKYISLNPGFHVFLFKGFSLGIDLEFEKFSESSNEYRSGAGYIMFHYFMGRKDSLIFPYVGAGVGGGEIKLASISRSFTGIKITTGVCFLFNDYIGIKTIAAYHIDSVGGSSQKRSGGRLRLGAGVSLFLF